MFPAMAGQVAMPMLTVMSAGVAAAHGELAGGDHGAQALCERFGVFAVSSAGAASGRVPLYQAGWATPPCWAGSRLNSSPP